MSSVHYTHFGTQKNNITFTNITVKATAMLKALINKPILYQKFVFQRTLYMLEIKKFT